MFIGHPSVRNREALLAYGANNEQGYAFEAFEHMWEPVKRRRYGRN